MTAEHVTHLWMSGGSIQTARGKSLIQRVMPFLRRLCGRMDQKHAIDAFSQRQLLQPFPLTIIEMLARPGRCHVCPGGPGQHGIRREGVVIASQDNRARALQLAAAFNNFPRVRTIAYEIAKNRDSVRALLARMRETGVKRRKIGMQVGEQGEFQASLSMNIRERQVCIPDTLADDFSRL